MRARATRVASARFSAFPPLHTFLPLVIIMSEGLNDPALLFTPVKATATNSLSSLSALSPPPESPTPAAEPLVARTGIKGNASCFVELPRIPNQEKEKYELLDIAESESDSDSDEIVELVGEYKLGDKLYTYAEHGDGIVRRVCVNLFRMSSCILLAL